MNWPAILMLIFIGHRHPHEGNCEPIPLSQQERSQSQTNILDFGHQFGRRIPRHTTTNGTVLTKSGQNFKQNADNPTERQAEADSDDMIHVFKALGLPADFADIKRSTQTDQSGDTIIHGAQSSPTPVTTTIFNDKDKEKLLYMTGSERLDKILRCPCNRDQLTTLGLDLHGYRSDYRNPPSIPYQADSSSNSFHHQRQHHTSSVLDVEHREHSLVVDGESKGKLFGQLIRLILDLPKLKLAILKPLILGLVDTTAQVTQKAAELKEHMAHRVPEILHFKADVLKKIFDTLGDAAGPFLHEISDHLHKAAWAKRSFADKLPHHLSVVGHKTEQVTSTIGKVADGLSSTKEKIAAEVIKAAKTKGKLVKGALEEGHAFKNGLLEGLKSHKQKHGQYFNEWSPSTLTHPHPLPQPQPYTHAHIAHLHHEFGRREETSSSS